MERTVKIFTQEGKHYKINILELPPITVDFLFNQLIFSEKVSGHSFGTSSYFVYAYLIRFFWENTTPKYILYVLSETLADVRVIYDYWGSLGEYDDIILDRKLRAIDHILSLYSILDDSEFNFLQKGILDFCLGPDFKCLDTDQQERNVVNHSFGHAVSFFVSNFKDNGDRRWPSLHKEKEDILTLLKKRKNSN